MKILIQEDIIKAVNLIYNRCSKEDPTIFGLDQDASKEKIRRTLLHISQSIKCGTVNGLSMKEVIKGGATYAKINTDQSILLSEVIFDLLYEGKIVLPGLEVETEETKIKESGTKAGKTAQAQLPDLTHLPARFEGENRIAENIFNLLSFEGFEVEIHENQIVMTVNGKLYIVKVHEYAPE
jgi:hypothetical protein